MVLPSVPPQALPEAPTENKLTTSAQSISSTKLRRAAHIPPCVVACSREAYACQVLQGRHASPLLHQKQLSLTVLLHPSHDLDRSSPCLGGANQLRQHHPPHRLHVWQCQQQAEASTN